MIPVSSEIDLVICTVMMPVSTEIDLVLIYRDDALIEQPLFFNGDRYREPIML